MANPKERTGYVESRKHADGTYYFVARIRHKDDYREWVEIPERYQRGRAYETALRDCQLWTKAQQLHEDRTNRRYNARMAALAAKVAGSVLSYAEAYYDRRKGNSSNERMRRMFRARIAPLIGNENVATIPKAKIVAMRLALDAEVTKRKESGKKSEGISGKTAMILWSEVRGVFRDACGLGRDPSVKVREDDPTEGVLPPIKSDPRRKTYLYPIEFAKLMAAELVPLAWRKTYAVGAYLYVRPGELRALRLKYIDLLAGVVSVERAYDEESKKEKTTKTKRGRRKVPIPATLMPLLREMVEQGSPEDLVAPHLGEVLDNKRALLFRDHLQLAKVTRERLYAENDQDIQINFRSLRDSGITWECLRGTSPERIQARAGHANFDTTLGYVKEVEDLRGDLGEPFGALPFAPLPEGASAVAEAAETADRRSGPSSPSSSPRTTQTPRKEAPQTSGFYEPDAQRRRGAVLLLTAGERFFVTDAAAPPWARPRPLGESAPGFVAWTGEGVRHLIHDGDGSGPGTASRSCAGSFEHRHPLFLSEPASPGCGASLRVKAIRERAPEKSAGDGVIAVMIIAGRRRRRARADVGGRANEGLGHRQREGSRRCRRTRSARAA
jgi:integrase